MQVTKSYGTSGEVVISLNGNDPRDFDLKEPLFIFFDELPVPFFMEKCEVKGIRMIVKLEDIDSYDEAEEIVGRDVFLDEYEDGDEMPGIIGMMVIDQKGTQIGEITDFHDFNGNTCISVDYNGAEVLLPFNEELIAEVTDDTIILRIPEGLI